MDLTDPGMEHRSPGLQADSLPSKPPRKTIFPSVGEMAFESHDSGFQKCVLVRPHRRRWQCLKNVSYSIPDM